MNVLQHLPFRRAGQRHAQAARKLRQHVRCALQIIMRTGHPGKTLLDLPAPLNTEGAQLRVRAAGRRDSGQPSCRHAAGLRDLPHVIAESRRGRNTACRCVRLLQKSCIAQRSHHVAQRG